MMLEETTSDDGAIVPMDTSIDEEISHIPTIEGHIPAIEGRVNQHRNRGSQEGGEIEEEVNSPMKQEVESGTLAAARMCGYLTDVEGNYEYFEKYVEISRVLQWTDAGRTKLELVPGAEFVFGGDTQDKGIGDIRFVKVLLDLKKRYPDRVHLLVGNRDCNKLRLAAELSPEALEDEGVFADNSFPYWVEPAKRVTPAMYLARNSAGDEVLRNNATNRLKWMLKETMGSDGAFERRRMELGILTAGQEEISDEEVVESYRREVDVDAGEDAFMLEYLRKGQLAHIFGKTLFVHGGVNDANMGTVPGKAARVDNVKEWVRELNEWMRSEVAAFELNPKAGKNSKQRAGHGLMDYGVPGGNGGKTVVIAHHLKNGNADKPSRSVEKYLSDGGIASLLTGHQPHGDCPCPIRGEKVLVVSADTSYSKMGHKEWWGVDNRGDRAVSEVLVMADGSVHVHGFLDDGQQIEYVLGVPGEEGPECDPYVGRQLEDKWWVKAKLKSGTALGGEEEAEYILCLGVGFKINTAQLGLEGLKKQFHEDTTRCSFFTDVMGDYDYFERFVETSKVLSWADDDKTKLQLAEDAEIVFGGNAQDRGIGDIRFVRAMLDLKHNYSERVHLLVGDRDLNKLRMLTELSPSAIADPSTATDDEYPYWQTPPLTPQKFLDMMAEGAERRPENNAANRLRWMLHTMAADEAFERRRRELTILAEQAEMVSDEEVVEDFRRQVDADAGEEALMLRYLSEGKLAHVFGKTLFVHGGVTESNMGKVPGREGTVEDVKEWVKELNSWLRDELHAFEEDNGQEIDKKKRPGRRLMDYALPGGALGRSVVSETHLHTAPIAVPQIVEDYLASSGISAVLTGHIPHGDCPAVIKREKVIAMSCDTSLSDVHHQSAWGTDHRGKAACEVLVHRDGSLEVHGRLADGRQIEYALADQQTKSQGGATPQHQFDPFIGRQLADTSWIKAKIKPSSAFEAADPQYQLCYQSLRPSPAGPQITMESKYVSHSFLSRVQPYRPPPPAPALPPTPPQQPPAAVTPSPTQPPLATNSMQLQPAPAPPKANVPPATVCDCCGCLPPAQPASGGVANNSRQV